MQLFLSNLVQTKRNEALYKDVGKHKKNVLRQSLILIISFLFLLGCGDKIKSEKFNKEKWKTGTQIERGNMSTDLIESKILIGKTKSEIIALLGEPKDSSNTNFHYLVDFGYMIPFDLNIDFDKKTLKVYKTDLSD